MHLSALNHGRLFFDTYLGSSSARTILDIGSQDINGSLRHCAPAASRYIGVDFVPGSGVDVVLDDPYRLPFADASIDVVVSSSCFEHIEFFWLMFNEVLRVLAPDGLLYLNAPANGDFHRYPVDCWRFYPDSGVALTRWGQRSGFPCVLLESFSAYQDQDIWNDQVAVFLKDEAHVSRFPTRMLDRLEKYMNGRVYGSDALLAWQTVSEDRMRYITGAKI
ncbi:hypothetical protein AZSI13_08870 [Azospira sp. I13]|uniref:methyltransferase domain-containing protein n=1 Tax=Azospira sp. I13 TaxID=1765050 RepID=UPI000D46C27E|nr:class I SAM-dependent methyltransferase [Azospira sp. I13]GBG01560.1 hypothetical protein AZSI13_08870 [Azospira sp. I13]